VICFSGVIDPGESKNPYAVSRKSIRDAKSTLVEIDANFGSNLFGNVNRPFCCVFCEDSESGLGFGNGRETGREVVNFNGMNC